MRSNFAGETVASINELYIGTMVNHKTAQVRFTKLKHSYRRKRNSIVMKISANQL